MLTSVAFDTLDYFDKLMAAGVPDAQARVQAEFLRDQVEQQTGEIRRAIEKYDESRRAELATKGDVQDVRLEIEKVRAELKTDIEKVKYDLLKWQIAGWLTLAAIMAKGFGWLGF